MIPRGLSLGGGIYVSCVILAGAAAISASIYELYASPVGFQWFILAGLTVISGSATVRLPSIPATLSVSETFVFTSVLLFGAPAGTLTVALDGLIISLWFNKSRKALHRVLFNVSAPALSIWTSAKIFFLVAGIRPLVLEPSSISDFLLPLVLFTILYFLLNSWLIAWAVSFETGTPAAHVWRTNFLWLSLNFFSGASVAALLTVYPLRVDSSKADLTFLTYLGAILPLLLVLYLTYRTSMARVEDANRHLTEINDMYLSTIETLAMAVDATDQVTHGHIRRVQSYAVSLAKDLGISDPGLIRAIEAASLLHDVGKLAVPEHILNKPGKLTDAEFDKMKLHASIGADILAAIHFPYPVIPIVRHHHENWNGTGYPDGLKGTDIPIGARILSVVDCFDALTSDRPYRPRLPDNEAIAILLQRRGTMYDPLVVDRFVHVHQQVDGREATIADERSATLLELTRSIGGNRSDDRSSRRTLGSVGPNLLAVSKLTTAVVGLVDVSDLMKLISTHVQAIVKYDVWTLMRYNKGSDALELAFVDGIEPAALTGWATPVGQRLSGWVAATKQPAVNSSPSLDFDWTSDRFLASLRSALVVPVVHGEQLIAVMGFYCRHPEAYDASDRLASELVAAHLSGAIAGDGSMASPREGPNLLTLDEAEQRLTSMMVDEQDADRLAVVLLREADAGNARAQLDLLWRGLVRPGDLAFATDREFGYVVRCSGRMVALRLLRRLELELSVTLGRPVSLSMALVPEDGSTLIQAVTIARRNATTKQSAA